MGFRLLSIEDFYTAEERFWERVAPTSMTEDGWRGAVEAARTDLEWVVAHETRYKYKGTRRVPHGQVITVEDWHVEGDAHVVHVYAHLHEDRRRTFPDEPWQTEAFGYRRRILKKAELAASLRDVGFDQTVFLPQAHPWEGYRVTARKPAAEAAASGRGDPPHVRLRPARPPA